MIVIFLEQKECFIFFVFLLKEINVTQSNFTLRGGKFLPDCAKAPL